MTEWGKVAVGARLSRIDPAFFVSWSALLMAGLRPGDRALTPSVCIPHAPAMNMLTKRFLGTDADSLLSIDDDMVFDPGALNRLRSAACGLDVLSGLYVTRRDPYLPVVLRMPKEGGRPDPVLKFEGVIETDFVGMAFTLMTRRVLKAVGEKYKGEPFAWDNFVGEDGLFCLRARELDFRVGVCADCVVGHRITMTGRWDMGKGRTNMAPENFGVGEI